MGQGGTKVWRVNIADKYDPRTTGRAAQKGTLFLFIPDSGDAELLIKQDDGFSTNWTGAGSEPLPITVVQAGSVANVNVAAPGAAIDGYAFTDAGVDKVLLKDQTLPAENGVYVWNGPAAPLTRAAGWDASADFIPGRQVFVDNGTVNADKTFTLADYVPDLGTDPVVFVSSGGGVVVGDPNTLAYFKADGSLADNLAATFDETTNSMGFGLLTAVGTITSTGTGSLAKGLADDTGDIGATGDGSIASGSVSGTGSQVEATNIGALAMGQAITGGSIVAGGIGSIAMGNADGGLISSPTNPALALGRSTGAGSIIQAVNIGSVAFGHASGAGTILSSGNGSAVFGEATGAGATLSSTGVANLIFGSIVAGAITSSRNCNLAFGFVNTGSIVGSGVGTVCFGVANTAGSITTSGAGVQGSMAYGVSTNGSVIRAAAAGCLARGSSQNGVSIIANGLAACAMGAAISDSNIASGIASFVNGDGVQTSADLATVFGLGNVVNSYGALVIGRFATALGTPATWVDTEPLFVLGNGTSIGGGEANAYQVDKDGRQTTTASHVDQIRVIVGDDALSARTDYKAVLLQAGGGAFTLTLPTGEEGLTFSLVQAAANTAVFTLAATGGNVIDPNVQSILNTNQPTPVTFTGGTWYAI